jgi:hypothetical protein
MSPSAANPKSWPHTAVVAGYGSIPRLINPELIANVGVVLAGGLIGFPGNELVAVYRIRIGRKIGSAALVADGLHARTDGFGRGRRDRRHGRLLAGPTRSSASPSLWMPASWSGRRWGF